VDADGVALMLRKFVLGDPTIISALSHSGISSNAQLEAMGAAILSFSWKAAACFPSMARSVDADGVALMLRKFVLGDPTLISALSHSGISSNAKLEAMGAGILSFSWKAAAFFPSMARSVDADCQTAIFEA